MSDDDTIWLLEGVGASARKAAQMAAPAAGLPVAAWLTRIIRRAAAAERLAARAAAGEDVLVFHRPVVPPATENSEFDGRLNELADRIAETERLADEIAAPLAVAVENISQRLSKLERGREK
ncbi:MAG: hypothetical protein ACTSRY_02645 [Alphaproteobacteria bacterium]